LAYPAHPYYDYLMQQPSVVSKFGLNKSEITYDKMRNSILRLNIYYEALSYSKVEEAIKVQLFDVISGIGGTMVFDFISQSFIFWLILSICLFQIQRDYFW
jgi:hypothetical protein